jgi:hypothetical protein
MSIITSCRPLIWRRASSNGAGSVLVFPPRPTGHPNAPSMTWTVEMSEPRSYRSALEIEVIEICPPHGDTDLGAPGINKAGISVDVFANAVMDELRKGTVEITYGYSTTAANASRPER